MNMSQINELRVKLQALEQITNFDQARRAIWTLADAIEAILADLADLHRTIR